MSLQIIGQSLDTAVAVFRRWRQCLEHDVVQITGNGAPDFFRSLAE